MKKNYIAPSSMIAYLEMQQMMAGSGVTGKVDETDAIGFGGVDTDGKKNPSSRRGNVWEDEELEEEY